MLDIKLEQFEGPLELLLRLIENEKLAITEISLATVTDEYLKKLEQMSFHRHVDELADFLVIAAKLLLIKSRRLLPSISGEEEEEIAELERRLKIYKEFHEAATTLQKMWNAHRVCFPRSARAVLPEEVRFLPPKRVDAAKLEAVFGALRLALQTVQPIHRLTFDSRISIQDSIARIRSVLEKRMHCSFSHVLEEKSSRSEIIVSFLALLELVKQREAQVSQERLFEDIRINRVTSDQRGQTFVELLTAIFVLSLALVGALGLTTSNAHNQSIGSFRLVASNLAREGVETARAFRDTNWLSELGPEGWDAGLKDTEQSSHCALLSPAPFISTDQSLVSPFSFVECKKDANGKDVILDDLYRIYRSDDGSFAQSAVPADAQGKVTLFYRKIRFDPICLSAGTQSTKTEDDCGAETETNKKVGVLVTSETWWAQGTEIYNVKAAEQLMNWR
ncbi:segregation/condensation protein A [Candidatus Uhrbacteria bacterium]|nr:segregation/condensation protein A [Candidatus Uhrbacteria bacterium]